MCNYIDLVCRSRRVLYVHLYFSLGRLARIRVNTPLQRFTQERRRGMVEQQMLVVQLRGTSGMAAMLAYQIL